MSDADDFRDYNQEVLARVAKSAGQTPEEFVKSFQKNFESIHFTSDCLTLEEAETLASGNFLTPERDEHMRGCEYCTQLERAINREPNEKHKREFIEKVTKGQEPSKK